MERSWLVSETAHERYSFDTEINIYHNITLEKLVEQLGWTMEDVEKHPQDEIYTIDKTIHNELDTTYAYPEFKGTGARYIGLENCLIVPLDYLLAEESAHWIWGQTNTKFGLIDKKGEL